MYSGSVGSDLLLALALGRDPVLQVCLPDSPEWSCLAGFGQWELLGSLEAERKEKQGSLVNVLALGHVSAAALPLFRLLLLPQALSLCFSSSCPS